MEQKEVLIKILNSRKRLVEYYPYPTGPKGINNIIVKIDSDDTILNGTLLKNIISLIVQIGAVVAGCPNDNKTAVKITVEGLGFPVYFIRKDRVYYISQEIKTSAISKEIDYVIDP